MSGDAASIRRKAELIQQDLHRLKQASTHRLMEDSFSERQPQQPEVSNEYQSPGMTALLQENKINALEIQVLKKKIEELTNCRQNGGYEELRELRNYCAKLEQKVAGLQGELFNCEARLAESSQREDAIRMELINLQRNAGVSRYAGVKADHGQNSRVLYGQGYQISGTHSQPLFRKSVVQQQITSKYDQKKPVKAGVYYHERRQAQEHAPYALDSSLRMNFKKYGSPQPSPNLSSTISATSFNLGSDRSKIKSFAGDSSKVTDFYQKGMARGSEYRGVRPEEGRRNMGFY